MLNVIICNFREGHFVAIFFFIHSVLNRSPLKMKICKICWKLFLSLLVWQINHFASNIFLSLLKSPSIAPQLTLKNPPIFRDLCCIKHLLWQFESTEYHILAFLMVIIRFHTKTYWGSREFYVYKYIIKNIYDKKKYKYCRSIVICILYFTWELISAYTVCDFDKNVLVLLRN